jgi:zinc transporter 9
MTLSQSQLRFISSLGIGILVGTSLIVIIPEGIEAVATTGVGSHSHGTRHALRSSGAEVSWGLRDRAELSVGHSTVYHGLEDSIMNGEALRDNTARGGLARRDDKEGPEKSHDDAKSGDSTVHSESELPTFFIGFALMAGFVLMFLVDRLPRHATENFQSAPATRHISLDNLASSTMTGDEESETFLGSLTPTPKQSRSLATTTGLVIHAAADGIAMGASATTSDMKLGLIIFVAIMVHKAPAAFGLTSVLLKQGLSKRAARGHLIVFSLAAPIGALATFLIVSMIGGDGMEGESGQWWTGMLLLFSGGTFL